MVDIQKCVTLFGKLLFTTKKADKQKLISEACLTIDERKAMQDICNYVAKTVNT